MEEHRRYVTLRQIRLGQKAEAESRVKQPKDDARGQRSSTSGVMNSHVGNHSAPFRASSSQDGATGLSPLAQLAASASTLHPASGASQGHAYDVSEQQGHRAETEGSLHHGSSLMPDMGMTAQGPALFAANAPLDMPAMSSSMAAPSLFGGAFASPFSHTSGGVTGIEHDLSCAPPQERSLAAMRLPTLRIPPIEVIAPIWRIRTFVDLFFAHCHPLTPLVHRPSFLKAFGEGEYATRPSFFALTCSMLAITLVTVPRLFIGLPPATVSRLAAYSNSLARDQVAKEGLDPPLLGEFANATRSRVPAESEAEYAISRYFDHIYHFHCRHMVMTNACHTDALAIAHNLHLDRPDNYAALKPIEAEMRKRMVWILYSSDKDNALFGDFPVKVRWDWGQVAMPAEVDDKQCAKRFT